METSARAALGIASRRWRKGSSISSRVTDGRYTEPLAVEIVKAPSLVLLSTLRPSISIEQVMSPGRSAADQQRHEESQNAVLEAQMLIAEVAARQAERRA